MIEHRSQVYRRTLLCDHPRCRVRIHLEGETLKAAYDDAQGQGWLFVTEATDKGEMAMRREYCPEHAAAHRRTYPWAPEKSHTMEDLPPALRWHHKEGKPTKKAAPKTGGKSARSRIQLEQIALDFEGKKS